MRMHRRIYVFRKPRSATHPLVNRPDPRQEPHMSNQAAATPATSVAELERLKVMHNGEKVPLTFSDTELKRSITGLRSIMAAKQLDAVVRSEEHTSELQSPLN